MVLSLYFRVLAGKGYALPFPVFGIAASLTLLGQTCRVTLNKEEVRLCFRVGDRRLFLFFAPAKLIVCLFVYLFILPGNSLLGQPYGTGLSLQ